MGVLTDVATLGTKGTLGKGVQDFMKKRGSGSAANVGQDGSDEEESGNPLDRFLKARGTNYSGPSSGGAMTDLRKTMRGMGKSRS